MSLQIITASDIVGIGSGSQILPNILLGINHRTSTLEWPNCLPFPPSWISTWKNILTTIIQPILITSPLGPWNHQSHQQWQNKLSYSQEFVASNNVYYKLIQSSRRPKYKATLQRIPCELNADIIFHDDYVELISSGPQYSPPVPPPVPTTAWEYYLNAPKWQKTNWGTAPITPSIIDRITLELKNNNISCAGDGSVLFGRAAHAWCVFTKDNHKIILRGSADVYGDSTDINSFRPEAFGCIAAFSLIHLISSSIPSLDANVQYFTDSNNTVLNNQRPFLHDTASVLETDIDATIEIHRLIKKCKAALTVIHVDGHQDLDKDENDLSPLAKINMAMDHLAGKHVRQLIFNNRNTTKTTFLPSQQIAVCIKNTVTVSTTDDKLRGSFYKNNIIQHYQNTVGLSDTLFDQINWDAIHLATRNHINRNQILKCLHNQWPTMARSFKWQQSDTDICQMCNNHSESWQHILRCSYLHMSRARTTSISKIKNELLILKTNPTLINHFMYIITTWTDNSNPLPPPIDFQPYTNEIRQAHFTQQQIGFDLFMKRMLDRRWQRIQQHQTVDQTCIRNSP